MSPSTATQMDSKIPNQSKPGSTGSQSQPSPCDPKTLGAKGAPNVAGGMGLKNGQGLTSGPSSKVKVKRERSTSVESFEQPESGTPTSEEKGKKHRSQLSSLSDHLHVQQVAGVRNCQIFLVKCYSQFEFQSLRLFYMFLFSPEL